MTDDLRKKMYEEAKDFSEEQLKIINDEHPPEFYDPFEVLKLNKWIELGAKVSVGIAIVFRAVQFPFYLDTASSYFRYFPEIASLSSARYLIALLAMSLNIGLHILAIYFPLKALAQILRILMEMEFNSRKSS
jgi:hypothetical protein